MRALYASVTDEDTSDPGEIHVSWIDGPQGSGEQKRLSIYISAPEDGSPGWEVYAIFTGPGNAQEMRYLHTPADVLAAVRRYQALKPEEAVSSPAL